jgi:hypothetical protein
LPPLEPASYDDDELDPPEAPATDAAPDWQARARRLRSWSDEERTGFTVCPPWPEQREEALSTIDTLAVQEACEAGGLRPFVSKMPPGAKPLARIPAEASADFALPPAPPLPTEETEALLNGVISDCRLFMREIAFHSARLAAFEGDRTGFIHAAAGMARAAARVGDTIARTRMAKDGAFVDERRQRIVVERIERSPAMIEALPAQGRGDR